MKKYKRKIHLSDVSPRMFPNNKALFHRLSLYWYHHLHITDDFNVNFTVLYASFLNCMSGIVGMQW